MRWDWQIGRVTPLQRTGRNAVDIYDIDGFLTTRARSPRSRPAGRRAPWRTRARSATWTWPGRTTVPTRPRAAYFPAGALGNVYFGFPEERWVDFRQLDALKPMLRERIGMCARKGFDAVELDDIDGFDPPSTTGFHLTPGDVQNYLAYAFNLIHQDGMTGAVEELALPDLVGAPVRGGRGGRGVLPLPRLLRGAVPGQPPVRDHLHQPVGGTPCGWDDFTAAGQWVGEAEYAEDGYVCSPSQQCKGPHSFGTFCRSVSSVPHGYAAVRFGVDLDGKIFYPCRK